MWTLSEIGPRDLEDFNSAPEVTLPVSSSQFQPLTHLRGEMKWPARVALVRYALGFRRHFRELWAELRGR